MYWPSRKNKMEMVPEFNTGIMLLKEDAVEMDAKIEIRVDFAYKFVDGKVYLRKGSEPEWDYVKVYYYKDPQFFVRRPDMEVDEKGKPVTTKK